MQAATFNYDMVYKVAKAISDEVRAKVIIYKQPKLTMNIRYCSIHNCRIMTIHPEGTTVSTLDLAAGVLS